MSTRRLILLALACGLAILVAGGIQLLRISNNEASTLREGDSTELSTVRATVLAGVVVAGGIEVDVRLDVPAGATSRIDDAGAGWSLLTGGLKEPVAAEASSGADACAGRSVQPGETLACRVRFAAEPGAAGTTVVSFRYAGGLASWTLAL